MANRMNTDGFENFERDQKLQDRRRAHVARGRLFVRLECASRLAIVHDYFFERCHRMHEGSEVT